MKRKLIEWTVAFSIGLGSVGVTNHVLRVEPEQTITRNGNSVHLYEATIKGNDSVVVSPKTLVDLWRKQVRKTPEALMLAKAETESGFRPFIFRYESGRHKWDPKWKNYTEYEATSGGLFQIMGFHYQIKNWEELADINKQLSRYDDFMATCFVIQRMAPANGKDSIYRAISCYGATSIYGATRINPLSDLGYSAYLKYNKQNDI